MPARNTMAETHGRSSSFMDEADAEPASSHASPTPSLCPPGAELFCSRGLGGGKAHSGCHAARDAGHPPCATGERDRH